MAAKDQVISTGITLAAVGLGAYLVIKHFGSAVTGGIEDAANAVAGALVPDANAAVQTQQQQIAAALKAQGYPRVGSDLYNTVMITFNRPDLVVHNALTGGGAG